MPTKEQYVSRKEQGICVQCGKECAVAGKTNCAACALKANESARRYSKEHADRRSEQDRLYREKNKERIKERHGQWYKENAEYYRTYRKENPDKRRAWHLERNYNITTEEKIDMFFDQGGACLICGKLWDDVWVKDCCVDHTEVDGKPFVRGLLCRKCNQGIGLLNHDKDTLKSSVAYLERAEKLSLVIISNT